MPRQTPKRRRSSSSTSNDSEDAHSTEDTQRASSKAAPQGQSQPQPQPQQPTRTPRRFASVYTTSVGRLTTHGFTDNAAHARPPASAHRDTPQRHRPLTPMQALLGRGAVAVAGREGRAGGGGGRSDAQADAYPAELDEAEVAHLLPDADLIRALHVYAAEYYGALSRGGKPDDGGEVSGVAFKSMDETALLALGILLEETAYGVLGKEGYLVFTEGEESE